MDFRRLVTVVSQLSGGVWINCGSAVQLPETFLKALSVAENLGHAIDGFATANLDMIRHYRTEENVLRRLLESSAFTLAERLSRIRRRAGVAPGSEVISKEQVRRALGR